ncbi:MAG: photosystem II protein PsbQ [Synechococcaceae cyanobacterium]
MDRGTVSPLSRRLQSRSVQRFRARLNAASSQATRRLDCKGRQSGGACRAARVKSGPISLVRAAMALSTASASPSHSPLAPGGWFTRLLRSLASLALVLALGLGLAACDAGKAAPKGLAPEDVAFITRQAEGFLAARDRLPELASLVNQKNWVFTRNLIHGPMQEVGREMLYINQHLLPADRPEAEKRATKLKTALAQLDEAARLQDGDALRKGYIKVASGFGLYAQILPAEVQANLKQS